MTKKILIVEYAAAAIDIIKEIFTQPMFELTIVGEGEAAKRQLSDASFDMMISAAMLPKFHGFNLSQYARENYPDLRIILMSEVYKGMNYRQQAISQYRADDFFEKPFDKNQFKNRVFQLLGIDSADFKTSQEQVSAAPISDTKKIPTLSQLEKEEVERDRNRQMSSEDLFGDIIQEVEVSKPTYEIELNDVKKAGPPSRKPDATQQPISPETMELPTLTRLMQTPGPGKDSPQTQVLQQPPSRQGIPPVTQVMPRSLNAEPSPATKPMPTLGKDMSSPEVTQPIDLDIMDLIKGNKRHDKPKEQPKDQKFKKIEDDISRKFEETLSGLGLGSSKPKPRPAAPPTPPPPTVKASPPPASPPPSAKPQVTEVISTPPPPPPVMTKPEQADELGGYEILGLIGRGGMAEIYKAKRRGVRGFEKIIALKKILSGYGEDSKYLEMFVDEAKIAAELSHPNIVQIYDLGKKDDYYFIAMEYVFGKDLRLILHKLAETDTEIPEELAVFLTINVLKALDYAHSAKDSRGNTLDIVHRDVSPPNILVSYTGDVKLTDFGVSKASIKMHQTVAGALKGKILYMSPEQARAEETIDFRSDLYSAGIIMFELVTGKKLFLGNTEIITLQKVQEGKIEPPSKIKPTISPELEAIILKALEKDPRQRYQKASEMVKALEDYMHASFDNIPNGIHLAHFLFRLFQDEIRKQGLDIQLKPLPFIIGRKPRHFHTPPAAVPETPTVRQIMEPPRPQPPESDEPLELSQDMMADPGMSPPKAPLPEPVEPPLPPAAFPEEKTGMDKGFQPVIEINFDDDKTDEPAPREKAAPEPVPATVQRPAPSRPPAAAPAFSSFDGVEKTDNKTRNLIIIALAVIAILAAVILLLLGGSSSEEPGLNVQQPPATGQTSSVSPAGATPDGTQPTSDDTGASGSETGGQTPDSASGQAGAITDGTVDGEPGAVKTAPVKTKGRKDDTPGKQETSREPERTRESKKDKDTRKNRDAATREEKTKAEPVTQPEPKPDTEPKKTEPPVEKKIEEKPKTEPQQPETEKTGIDDADKAAETPVPATKQPVTEEKPPAPKPSPFKKTEIKEGAILSPSEIDTPATEISTPGVKVTHRLRRLMMADQRLLVSFLVDHNGNVETVKILKKSNLKRLNSMVEETIRTWKYKPATKNNIKVKVWKNKWVLIKK